MRKGFFSLTVLSLVTPLSLLATQVRADFLIKFVGSGQVIVRNYLEEGQTIKVYTPQGVISFRKDEVSSITEMDASQSMRTPLEAVTTVSTSSTEAKDSDKITKPEKKKTAATGDTSTNTMERIDGQYQEVEQEFNKLWEKHMHDVDSGASEEVLTENRNRLSQLSNERHMLVDDARRVAPDDLPTWAQ